jgi:hypothetical protein
MIKELQIAKIIVSIITLLLAVGILTITNGKLDTIKYLPSYWLYMLVWLLVVVYSLFQFSLSVKSSESEWASNKPLEFAVAILGGITAFLVCCNAAYIEQNIKKNAQLGYKTYAMFVLLLFVAIGAIISLLIALGFGTSGFGTQNIDDGLNTK